jgi:hypothetical protein
MSGESLRTDNQSEAPPVAPVAAGEASPLPTLISCPACALPAEITDRFTLASTDGPVDHIGLACIADHHFRMAVDRLPAGAQVLVQAGDAAGW